MNNELFGRHLLNLSRKRRASAERIEEKLEDAQPTLMDIHDRQQQRQNNQVRDVTGDHNTIHQVNTIRQIFRDEKQEGFFDKYLVGIIVGLAVNLFSKVMHIS